MSSLCDGEAREAAEQLGTALGFEGAVTKTGYLVKRQKSGGGSWKKRYFVLNGSSLIYYETHKKMDSAKGDLLLTVDCVVHDDVDEPKYPHCFEVVSAFETLRISASSDAEAEEWKAAIVETISLLGSRTRGFLDVRVRSTFSPISKWTRRFFVLHSAALTYHLDHKSTYKKLGEFKLTAATTVREVIDSAEHTLELELTTGDRVLKVRMRNAEELALWNTAMMEAVAKLAARDDLASKRGQENDEEVLIDGYLGTQPFLTAKKMQAAGGPTDDVEWPKRFYALTASALYAAAHDYSTEAGSVLLLDPTCSVYMTRLRANAFEVVTSHGVLHVQGGSKAETQMWISSLRDVISQSSSLSSDPLLNAAKKLDLDTYAIHFETKQKLNIVLERAAEWAVVKESHKVEVTEGSALVAVNGESTMLQPYADTIRALTGWEPPLELRGHVKNWKQRFFVLEESKLSYYADESDPGSLRDCVHLMGSVVSVVSSADSGGLNFCFRLISGVAVVVMQATTLEEMIAWATTLYHAIAIANGGGYLLNVERKKRVKRRALSELDELRDREEQALLEKATEDARRRSVENAEAAAAARRAADLAKQATVRAEAARAEAEVAAMRASHTVDDLDSDDKRASSMGRLEVAEAEATLAKEALEAAELRAAEAAQKAQAEADHAEVLEAQCEAQRESHLERVSKLEMLNHYDDVQQVASAGAGAGAGGGGGKKNGGGDDDDDGAPPDDAAATSSSSDRRDSAPSSSAKKPPPPPPPSASRRATTETRSDDALRRGSAASSRAENGDDPAAAAAAPARRSSVVSLARRFAPPRLSTGPAISLRSELKPVAQRQLPNVPQVPGTHRTANVNNNNIIIINKNNKNNVGRVAAAASGAAAVVAAPDDDDEDDCADNSEDSEDDDAPPRLSKDKKQQRPSRQVVDNHDLVIDTDAGLTDEELLACFGVVEGSEAKGHLNTMQFVALLRAVGVSDHDLKFELDLFHEFDSQNSGIITKAQFVEGFNRYIDKHKLHPKDAAYIKQIVHGIRAYQAKGTFSL